MMQSLAAIFLLRCLKAKNYYPIEPNADPKRLSEEELYLSLLIHHFMRVTYYNTHEITTTDEDTNGVGFGTDRLAMRRIGRATNPTLALLNHTCDPNYRRISVGRQVRILCSTSERTDLHSFLHLLFAVSVQQRRSAAQQAGQRASTSTAQPRCGLLSQYDYGALLCLPYSFDYKSHSNSTRIRLVPAIFWRK